MESTIALEAAPPDERDASLADALTDAYPRVYRALVAFGAQPHDAADAVQDAIEYALRRRPRVASPSGWLFVVSVRAWKRDRWRRRLVRPLETLRGGERFERDERIDLLHELARLTERQRAVVVARYVLGLSQQETADALGISRGTVAATTHQATEHLRKRLIGGAT